MCVSDLKCVKSSLLPIIAFNRNDDLLLHAGDGVWFSYFWSKNLELKLIATNSHSHSLFFFFLLLHPFIFFACNQDYQQIIVHRRTKIISTECWLWQDMKNEKYKDSSLEYRFSVQHHILFWVNALSTGRFCGRWNVYFRRKNSARGRI